MRGQKWGFAPEGARGMPEVSPIKMGGQSKVLKPLLWFCFFLTNFYTLAGSWGNKSGFLHQKGLGGSQRYLLSRGWGNWRFENPYLDFGYFEKMTPPCSGSRGRIGVANNFGGNTSVRDQCVRVALILGHIYPQYEFKVIFLVAYPPLVTPVGNHFTIGLERKKNFTL